MKNTLTLILIVCFIAGSVYAKTTVNKSIRIEEGEHHSGGCSSVNGSIVVEEGARVRGGCKTVNGSIKIAEECKVRGLHSVNGSIRVGEETEIDSNIETVNGSIDCQNGVNIDGDIKTVNGSIKLQGTEVKEGISTHNGSITMTRNSIVHEDIVVKDSKGRNNRRDPLRIIVDNSVVEGDIINKEEDIEVIVIIKNGGRVKGDIYDAYVEED